MSSYRPDRRDVLKWTAAGLGAAAAGVARGDDTARPSEESRRTFLRRLLYDPADVKAWLAGTAFPFSKYDPELGYLHIDRDFKEGLDGAVCSYRYDKLGARRTINHADKPCRINTYGDSFTSCEQVSDGETWQEALAAHLGEPIRNYGIGGYSVYLAYRRMLREEKKAPASFIILNIFDDDHYRNLLGWQCMRFGVNRKSTNPPIASVHADTDTGKFEERPNPCPTPEALSKLCDLDTAYAIFKDDYLFNRYVHREQRRKRGDKNVPASDFDDPELTRHALYASKRIVEKVEEFAAQGKRTVLYVLSYNPNTVRRRLKDGSRFDQAFVDYLKQKRLPYVDLLEAHAADYAGFAPNVEAYVKRYFIGHYSPLGNHFCAFAIKDKVAKMLRPAPAAYAPGAREF